MLPLFRLLYFPGDYRLCSGCQSRRLRMRQPISLRLKMASFGLVEGAGSLDGSGSRRCPPANFIAFILPSSPKCSAGYTSDGSLLLTWPGDMVSWLIRAISLSGAPARRWLRLSAQERASDGAALLPRPIAARFYWRRRLAARRANGPAVDTMSSLQLCFSAHCTPGAASR